MVLALEPLSGAEMELVSSLEFHKKYFFTSADVDSIAGSRMKRYNIIKNLRRKKRIVRLNRNKYYLIPVRAKGGYWSEHPFVLVDEMMDGKDYFIGGWAAANHWGLTEQIPMRTDVYTTRRQGKVEVLNSRIVFHRSTRRRVESAIIERVADHPFRVLPKEESRKWLTLHR